MEELITQLLEGIFDQTEESRIGRCLCQACGYMVRYLTLSTGSEGLLLCAVDEYEIFHFYIYGQIVTTSCPYCANFYIMTAIHDRPIGTYPYVEDTPKRS